MMRISASRPYPLVSVFFQPPQETCYLTHITVVAVIKGNGLPDIIVAIAASSRPVVGSVREKSIAPHCKGYKPQGEFIMPLPA